MADIKMQADRRYLEALDKLFNHFALQDQKVFYEQAVERNNRAAGQVNFIRASASLVAGIAAAVSGLIVQSVFGGGTSCSVAGSSYCDTMHFVVSLTTLIAVIAPAVGAAFNSLSDLYQWERSANLYKAALESLAVADAYSPDVEESDVDFRASLNAYAKGTLDVMENETAQWGQLLQSPEQIEKFLAEARQKSERLIGGALEQRLGRGPTSGSQG
ncbi:MAG: hypothetical protein IAE83_09920 [Anaerolinea sp.]|nr:hypothetical protein [Anaerolinea sp.]